VRTPVEYFVFIKFIFCGNTSVVKFQHWSGSNVVLVVYNYTYSIILPIIFLRKLVYFVV